MIEKNPAQIIPSGPNGTPLQTVEDADGTRLVVSADDSRTNRQIWLSIESKLAELLVVIKGSSRIEKD